jgi:hypothetical protein
MEHVDPHVEEKACRQAGLIGRGGGGMGNALFAIDYSALPPEAIATVELIVQGGPFPYPRNDGTVFGNRFGDLPEYSDSYLEFTVPTPGVANRGARRIVARKSGVLFFTACHYERIQGRMSLADRRAATARVDEQWRNGFYVVTGMPLGLREQLRAALSR